MRSPRIPPMLTTLVQEALDVFNGAVFDSREACPACGGLLSGYDLRKRQFARVTGENGPRTIMVLVRRFRCRQCGRICNADEPFYPDTRIGAPVIDLCLTFSDAFGYGRAARSLFAMGIAVNRMQCRHFAVTQGRPGAFVGMYGFPVPQSILSLSMFATGAAGERGSIKGAELLAPCGFPSARRTAFHRTAPGEERDDRDEKKSEKEGDPPPPEQERNQ